VAYPTDLYKPPLGLLTDLYQLTMAFAAFKAGLADRQAEFHLTFRKNPFEGGFTLVCGLAAAAEYLEQHRFSEDDLAYLKSLHGRRGPLFDDSFLEWLRDLHVLLDVDAMQEGTVAFPHEPILRVRGPAVAAMLVETPLLTLLNFETLVATKAARVCLAAQGRPVVEFGLRRAQGPDGGVSAARAAYVGGCEATSNLLAGKLFGIPVRGTHAHSWVMLHDDERSAFRDYAAAMPDDCIFLVDTYDSLAGVGNAIEEGRALRAAGHELLGIRLDSGDLAWLSQEARKRLDAAGFSSVRIFASNDLDEHVINSLLKEQAARIDAFGVGTSLVAARPDAALGGVYKLSAVREGESWTPRLKLSEQQAKITTPGVIAVRRYRGSAGMLGDLLYDEELGISEATLVDPTDPTRRKSMPKNATHEELLLPVFRAGRRVYQMPPLEEVRRRAMANVAALDPAIVRFVNPHLYPVGLEPRLHDRRMRLIFEARTHAR
jgi:nicotinate phosphoribosyltransferase